MKESIDAGDLLIYHDETIRMFNTIQSEQMNGLKEELKGATNSDFLRCQNIAWDGLYLDYIRYNILVLDFVL